MIDAKWFFSEFIKVVTEDKYLDIYRNEEPTFTKIVTTEINSIIKKVGITPQNEYYRIDIVGWQSRYEEVKKEAEEVGLKPHLWDLEIVVEHENNKMDWTDELIKLAYVRCPLKIIICYNYCDCRDDDSFHRSDKSKLKFVVNGLNKLKRCYLEENEELLIIMGNAAPYKGAETYKKFDYRGYLLKHNDRCFSQI
ncbi:MAG: hypothetical protein IKO54_07070 [Lachnospiraceae bacterium]|nr:hypothetical protein [Lachnospiraceae bacterium]